MSIESHHKITPQHLARKAFVYIRQSTVRQVFENTESTKRQYDLNKTATSLGWPAAQIVVIYAAHEKWTRCAREKWTTLTRASRGSGAVA